MAGAKVDCCREAPAGWEGEINRSAQYLGCNPA
jgi:hypothetical protein